MALSILIPGKPDAKHYRHGSTTGPHEASMDQADERQLLATIELLGDLGIHTAVLRHRLPKEIIKTLESFYQIGVWYKRETIKQEVRKQLKHIRSSYQSKLRHGKISAGEAAVEAIDLAIRKLGDIK